MMQELAETERAALIERFGKVFQAGQALYREDENATSCYIVHEGRVKLVKEIRDTERSLLLLRPGELFGEEALVADSTRSSSAIALTDVTVIALERTTLGALLAGNAHVASRLMGQLVARLRRAEEQLENVMLEDAPSRVVNTLLRLGRGSLKSPDGHRLQLSPLEFSSRVGLEVDTVKQIIQQLREGGYVSIVKENIVVHDLEPLQKLYGTLGMKEEIRKK